MHDPQYVPLLAEMEDYQVKLQLDVIINRIVKIMRQLDEFSRKGVHSSVTMDQQISRILPMYGAASSRGRHWKEKLWLEQEGTIRAHLTHS
jgi:hypothetical protein